MSERFEDRLVMGLDSALRTFARVRRSEAQYPGAQHDEADLDDQQRRHAAGLMRVNHAGEVCAQALYRGQSLAARSPDVRETLHEAALEEEAHLAWCEQRLDELGSRPSVLNPIWFGASFAIGAVTGMLGDRLSLGFVAATEEKVGEHLARHREALPAEDERSAAVVEAMQIDEARHGETALSAGGETLPQPVRDVMARVARLMTWSSYRM